MVGKGGNIDCGVWLALGVIFGVGVFVCVRLMVGVTNFVEVQAGETGDDCEQLGTSKRRRITLRKCDAKVIVGNI
jgi:hypothetical protein